MNYEIFKDDKDRSDAVTYLENLEHSEGWKVILRALDGNIQHFDERIHEELRKTVKQEDVERVQDKIDFLEFLKTLPAILKREAHQGLSPDEEDDDSIYDLPDLSGTG